MLNIYKAPGGDAASGGLFIGRAMADQLYRDVDLRYTARLPVLGVVVTFSSNVPDVINIVYDTYGPWLAIMDRTDLVTPSTATIRIVLHDGPTPPDGPITFQYRVPDDGRLVVSAPGALGVVDIGRLDAVAYVTGEIVARRADFVDGILETLTLTLLGALDRQPVHAAGIVLGDLAVVLAGPSGVGKSTLAYAAQRRGDAVLSDEAIYVQMRPRLRVWGRRARIQLPVDARRHFAELGDVAPVRLTSGKTKMVIEVPDGCYRRYADRTALCLLARGDGVRPLLERVPTEALARTIGDTLEPGFDLYASTLRERVAQIAGRGGWRLWLRDAPEDALSALDEMVHQEGAHQ